MICTFIKETGVTFIQRKGSYSLEFPVDDNKSEKFFEESNLFMSEELKVICGKKLPANS